MALFNKIHIFLFFFHIYIMNKFLKQESFMKKDIEKEKLITKSLPYLQIWRNILKNKAVRINEKEDGEYSFIICAIEEDFNSLFEHLRTGTSNFIYIDGIGEGTRAQGLLCIDENPQLASLEDCFFVGIVSNEENHNEQETILTANQVYSFIGEDAYYLVGNVAILNKDIALQASLNSFFEILENEE